MTKVISLSEKAYATLKREKRESESFSDVILRISREQEEKSLLDFAGSWVGNDLEDVFSIVTRDRKRAVSRKIEI